MKRLLAGLVFACMSGPAFAGPPYLTDDPVPTDPGHWEVFAFGAGEARESDLDADAGLDVNYGAAKDLQLTATIPVSFSHSRAENWRGGTGDLELGVKYRFINDRKTGFSAAIFPRVILPTAAHSPTEKSRYLLPVWVEKDFRGGTTVFGGGGFTINPGRGNRDFWQAALAVTQDITEKGSVGLELTRQGSDAVGVTAQTRAGLGAILKLSDHYSLLVSGGPTWADHRTGYHFYGALGLDF